MLSPLLYGALALLLVSVFAWAWRRSKRIDSSAAEREAKALERMQAGKGLFEETQSGADTENFDSLFAGIPSQGVPVGHIDVADVTEAVDIERLLAGESVAVLEKARARLEEPTNIVMESDSLPPAPAGTNPLGDTWAARAAANAKMQEDAQRAKQVQAQRLQEQQEAQRLEAQRKALEQAQAQERFEQRRLQAQQAEQALLAERQYRLARQRALASESQQAKSMAPEQAPARMLPLKGLILAWFEARGYRRAPASPALMPIEMVLRHKDDPARVYGVVVEEHFVAPDRVRALREQAKSVGLMRLLVVANEGAEPEAYDVLRKKGVRVMDRAAIEQEFSQLDFGVAAKIIAVARQRAALESAQ
ncbi:MAG TPA: hypothetical protein PLQ67_00925 [Burkholderiaceae bacterium]|nr:hypothetical protein [Burkholderiaceae bacterium]